MVFNGTLGKDDFGSSRFNHINWQADFSLTKWFHPVMGARLQIQGGQYQNDTAFGNQYMKDPYIFTHMDFMVNLSNWIGGERDDRVYSQCPSPASVTTYRVSPTNSSATGATGRTTRSLSRPVC